MSTQQHLASVNHADRDQYARARVLNSAIIAADISSGWEEYLEIFEAFYADHVEVSDSMEQIQESPIHGDTADETHSAWSADLTGMSGRTCKLAWCTLRRWANSRVVYERHYDHRQTGGPLSGDDLRPNPSPAHRI